VRLQVVTARTMQTKNLCGQATLGDADVEVVGSGFVHFNATVADHEDGSVGQSHVRRTNRIEFD